MASNKAQSSNLIIGKVVNVAGIDWIVLDGNKDSVLCLTRDCVYKQDIFDSKSNNYANSTIRKKLNNEFLNELTSKINRNKILDTTIDLISDDGLDDYGYAMGAVGLLTADMYRQYNRIIEKYPVNQWWWLATPMSTPHRNWSTAVRIVDNGGTLDYLNCNGGNGVRPFCIFSSSIFDS